METKQRNRGILTGVLVLLMAVQIALAVCVAHYYFNHSRTPVITSELLGERLEYVQDLVTVEYYYTDVDIIPRAQKQIFGINIPFTGSRAIVSYDGVIKYGVDVSKVGIDVDGTTVTLTIPAGKIISHEVPEDQIKFFDEGRNLFNPVSPGDYVSFRVERRAQMEQRAMERGLPAAAQEKAYEALTAILSAMPGMEPYEFRAAYIEDGPTVPGLRAAGTTGD